MELKVYNFAQTGAGLEHREIIIYASTMKKKLVSKGWYTFIGLLPILIFSLIFFVIDLSDFLLTLLIILGIASAFATLFFTTKEEEKDKIKESKYKKSTEYYFLNFMAYTCILACIFFIITFFSSGTEGDEWVTNIFPYKVRGAYIILPGILAGICFRQADKFKKKSKK